jgi:hypothetical protein
LCAARGSGLPQQDQRLPQPDQHLSAYAQDHSPWDAPPQELQDVQRQGFRDGIEGARKDSDNHRRPDVNNRDAYRDPHVRRDQQEAYREGFRRGYERGMSHIVGGPMEPVGPIEQQAPVGPPKQQLLGSEQQMRAPDRGGRDMAPGMGMDQEQGSDIQRRGFRDGMDGARKDLDNHRQPNVNNRDEYRHPSTPRGVRDEYREAFRRGYDRGLSQMMGGQTAEQGR